MLFMVGIDHFCMPGADIERVLRAYWDIAEFEVVGLRQVGYVFYGIPTMINLRAEHIAQHLRQTKESAAVYIGVARGYDMWYTPTSHGAQTRCVCYDFAVALNNFGRKIGSVCLNKEQVHRRIRKDAPMAHDNEEMLNTLNDTVELFCSKYVKTP